MFIVPFSANTHTKKCTFLAFLCAWPKYKTATLQTHFECIHGLMNVDCGFSLDCGCTESIKWSYNDIRIIRTHSVIINSLKCCSNFFFAHIVELYFEYYK